MSKRRVLVLGGTGFIGGHAARTFAERGDEVSALVRSRARAERDERLTAVRLIVGDVAQASALLSGERFDVVVYTLGAWTPGERPSRDVVEARCELVYRRGLGQVAERARAWGAHLFFLSGVTRFGRRDDLGCFSESTEPGPLDPFGAGKRSADSLLASIDGLRSTSLCPPEVYGAHDPGSHLRFVFERIAARRFVHLGDGGARWSLCHVQNVVDAMVHLADGDGVGPLLVADQHPSSQEEIARAVAEAMGRSSRFVHVPIALARAIAELNVRLPRPRFLPEPFAPKHVRLRTSDRIFDTRKARSLGVVPRWSLKQGVVDAVAWWSSR